MSSEKVVGVIFAGGVGRRMNSKAKPKQFLDIHGKPIIVHTLEHFDRHPQVDLVVVVCLEEWIPYLNQLLRDYGIKKVESVVPGGKTGQLSIYNGLLAAKALVADDSAIVLVHDGVRPLINSTVITDNIESVRRHGSAITTAVVTETILVVDEKTSTIDYVPNRKNSRVAKAPQSFWLDDILSAHREMLAKGVSDSIDSCTMMHQCGFKLALVDGPSENIKVTTPGDFYAMRAILDAAENEQIYGFEDLG